MSEYRSLILQDQEMDLWDNAIEHSENATVFHQLAWLKAAEKHSLMKLLPLVIYKGDKLVCLCPLFYRKKQGFKILLSPPNSSGMPFLGPAFNIPASSRYNYERTFNEIQDEITSFSENQIGYDYFGIIHNPKVMDIRAYKNKGFSVNPCYTYIFNLQKGQDWLLSNFHRTTRNALKKADSYNEILISHDPKNAYKILDLLEQRYAEQSLDFKITKNYFNDLKNSSIKNNIEVISAFYQDQLIAGDIALTYKKEGYAWLGTVNRENKITGIGELVLWKKMNDLSKRGINSYDIVGANTPHICKHKSKYGADLIEYFEVYKTSFKGKIVLKLLNKSGKRS